LDILTLFCACGSGQFQNIEQLDNTEKVGFQPNIVALNKGIQIDYALTDLGNQSAALYSNIFVKVDLALLELSNFKNCNTKIHKVIYL
jgi:hypothetical protein